MLLAAVQLGTYLEFHTSIQRKHCCQKVKIQCGLMISISTDMLSVTFPGYMSILTITYLFSAYFLICSTSSSRSAY